MDINLFRLTVFLTGLGVMGLLETLFPCRPWQDKRSRRFGFHLGLSVFNNLILRLPAFLPLMYLNALAYDRGFGLLSMFELSAGAHILISLVIMDMLDYWWHRFNHRIPVLWRFHKVHHVDTHVDITTSLRFHPGELFLSTFVKASWILLLAPSVWAFVIFESAITLFAQFHHSNIDLGDRGERIVRSVIVTPRFHAAHHTVSQRTGDANFSTIFIFWDKLFGSYNEPDFEEMKLLGLEGGRETYLSFGSTLAAPFTRSY